MDHNLEAWLCRTVPCPGGVGEQDCCAGLEPHVFVLVYSQLPKGDCGCTGQCVNYPLLALSWALFEPKWTSVSTVTVTNGYTSLTTATLNDPHSSRKSQHTHIPGSTLVYRNSAQCFHSASVCLDQTWEGEREGEETGESDGESFVFHVRKRKYWHQHPLPLLAVWMCVRQRHIQT